MIARAVRTSPFTALALACGAILLVLTWEPIPLTSLGHAQAGAVTGRLTSGTCASGGCLSIDVTGRGAVGLQVTGTWSGTISFESSLDGATYVALNMYPPNSTSAATSTTSNGIWTSNVGGLALVRARMSTYTSGEAAVTFLGAPAGGTR